MENIETPEVESEVDVVTEIEADAAVEAVVVEEVIAVRSERPSRKAAAAVVVVSHAVSGDDVDDVRLGMCVYKNKYARKSLSVHHLQRRLTELGHPAAASDKDGWYGDETAAAVAEFRAERGLPESDVMDMTTFAMIFAGDTNVVIAD